MAFKAFLKLEGVDGQSPDSKHEKWIELTSFNHGMSQMGSFGKDGSLSGGTADVKEFYITKEMDAASPLICEKLVTGAKIDKAVVHLVSAIGSDDSHVFAKYEFTPCIVADYTIGGSTDKPVETVGIRFNIIRWEYTGYDDQAAGSAVRSGWDTGKSKKDSSNVSE